MHRTLAGSVVAALTAGLTSTFAILAGCTAPGGGGGTSPNANSPGSNENTNSPPGNANSNMNAAVNENANDDGACPTGTVGGETTVSYQADVFPLLQTAGCMTSGCHGGLFPSSLYDLTTYERTFGPGEQAQMLGVCNVVPGDPDASFLIEKLVDDTPRGGGDRMPLLRTPLPDADIELIRTWTREGAQDN